MLYVDSVGMKVGEGGLVCVKGLFKIEDVDELMLFDIVIVFRMGVYVYFISGGVVRGSRIVSKDIIKIIVVDRECIFVVVWGSDMILLWLRVRKFFRVEMVSVWVCNRGYNVVL